ncbi:MAG: hypothetical protein GXP55_09355 [Deltaproteobacteria bacterium]|nr:hypothetical protein [Deltaproteobacteria bacterium]
MADASLSPQERQRFARQLLLHEIGADGQLRLLGARFDAPSTRAGAIAADYLVRAGLRPGSALEAALALSLPSEEGDPVADALCGAFAAVEALKGALQLGTPGALDPQLLADLETAD